MTLLKNPKKNLFQILKESYRYTGIIFLTALLMLISLNILASWMIKWKRAHLVLDSASPKIINVLKPLYPGLAQNQIRELWKETTDWPFIYHPYTQHRLKPGKGNFIHIDEAGFRYIRDQAPWPPPEHDFNIFIFGGSTTFGWGVPDEETIASHLQDLFRSKQKNRGVNVYNFGQGAFFSTQERILFEELLTEGRHPDVAIFIDGINECALEEPLHTEEIRNFYDGKRFFFLNRTSIVTLTMRIMDRLKSKPALNQIHPIEAPKRMVERYFANKKMIEAIASSYKIQTVFIWQPAPLFKYDPVYQPFLTPRVLQDKQFIFQKEVYQLAEQIKSEGGVGKNFLWLADMQEHMKEPLYVDRIHYSPELCQIIASRIYDFLGDTIAPTSS